MLHKNYIMTRINANIPMVCLSDQLLLNELGEITRILDSVKNRIEKNQSFNDIPESFRLGTGHMKFFYNKCAFILLRYSRLRTEYLNRHNKQYSPDHFEETKIRYEFIEAIRPDLCNIWQATEEENNLIKQRILERSKTYKKHTYKGDVINDWSNFLNI